MTGDLANVSHACELVVWVHVEDVLDVPNSERSAKEVSSTHHP